ncbi:MAG: hypothetical protein QXO86_01490, partial [Nitrososphaerota archaeon]
TTQEYVLALNAAQDLVTHLLLREGATHVFPIETTLYEFQPPPPLQPPQLLPPQYLWHHSADVRIKKEPTEVWFPAQIIVGGDAVHYHYDPYGALCLITGNEVTFYFQGNRSSGRLRHFVRPAPIELASSPTATPALEFPPYVYDIIVDIAATFLSARIGQMENSAQAWEDYWASVVHQSVVKQAYPLHS